MNYLILIDHIIVSGSRFLISILVARALGYEDFGIYSLIWTIVTFSSAMQIPVSITPMMQLGSKVSEARQLSFFASAFLVQVMYSCLITPFVAVGVYIVTIGSEDSFATILAVILYILIFNQYEYFRRYFFIKNLRLFVLTLDCLLYFTILAILTGYIYIGDMKILSFFYVTAIPALGCCVIALWTHKMTLDNKNVHFVQIRRILNYAKPLIVSTIAGFVSGHIFVYSTGMFLGASEVGGIVAARNILGPLAILMMALENSMIREAVFLHKNSPRELEKYIKKTQVKWMVIFAFYAIFASVFASKVLELSYGEEFKHFANLVYWMAAASIPQVITRIQVVKLRTLGNLKAISRANIWAMYIACIVSPGAVYFLGIHGAGLSIIIVTSSIAIIQHNAATAFNYKK